MKMKRCSLCKQELPVSEFYPDKVYGWRYRCKECTKRDKAAKHKANPEKRNAYYEAYREANRKKSKAYARDYYAANKERWRAQDATPEGRAKARMRAKKYKELNPGRVRAVNRANSAIKSGTLVRKPCETCGTEPAQAHHDDYSKPLDVRWLCVRCHHDHHNLTRETESR